MLPADSGLRNDDFWTSQVMVAEKATGRRLKPSEVSDFWAAKARRFMLEQPGAAARLLAKKFFLLWNAYEIPNHVDFYFIRAEYAPVLKILFVSFGLIAPLALIGIAGRIRRGLGLTGKLLLGFLITYLISLLPFFITERYRLPLVPVLIAFAAVAVPDLIRLARRRAFRPLLGLLALGAAVAVFIHWPTYRFNYAFFRSVLATKYLQRAMLHPGDHPDDLVWAIRQFKQTIETDPLLPDGHYNLATCYSMLGYYSGAIREWETVLKLDPAITRASAAIEDARQKQAQTGDLIQPEAIPMSAFEEAKAAENLGRTELALSLLQELIRKDQFHFEACSDLGALYYNQGRYDRAVKLFKQGLEAAPDHFVLLNNLAGA
jgi:tetratricopeptide (TPR) repeat protein